MFVQGRRGLDYPGQRRQAAPQHLRTEAAVWRGETELLGLNSAQRRELQSSGGGGKLFFRSVLFPIASGETEGGGGRGGGPRD